MDDNISQDEGQRSNALEWTRRLTLMGMTAIVGGCASAWPDLNIKPLGATAHPMVDGHVHLFNGRDLPIRGFLKHVFLRQLGIDLGAGDAVIDLAFTLLERLALTAQQELGKRQNWRKEDLELPLERIAAEANKRSLEVAGARTSRFLPAKPRDAALAISYDNLLRILNRGKSYSDDDLGIGTGFLPPEALPKVAAARTDLFRSVANDSYAANPPRAAFVDTNAFVSFAVDAEKVNFAADRITDTVAWVFLMLQPRTQHLKRFMGLYEKGDGHPRIISNLLVDYDKWLDDHPNLPGSSHDDQIKLWAEVRRVYSQQLEIHTFAGYCPLKHALEKQMGVKTQFDRLQDAFKAGNIVGLKLYPPMGFRAMTNKDLSNADFVGDDKGSICTIALEAWKKVGGTIPLGQALDDALNDAFDWAKEHGARIVAHAGPSNLSAEKFKDRPNPKYWVEAVKNRDGLKVQLAHFAHDAKVFTELMEANGQGGAPEGDRWPLEATRNFVRHAAGSPINRFVDLAYSDELLKEPGLPIRFFKQLHRWCAGDANWEGVDPDFSQVSYGSDWIMLGMEHTHPTYLQMMIDAAKEAGWTSDQRDNLFYSNAHRFLS